MGKMKTLVCLGDSLTESSEVERQFIWPSLVENRLGLNVINSGICGDTTGGLLGRFYSDVVPHHPDYIIILGGTNDLWWDLDVALIRANIFTMTCQAEHHNIVPLIGLPPPIVTEKACRQDFAAPEGGYAKFMKKLSALVKTLSISAAQNDIVCLDFYRPFLNDSGVIQEKYFLEDGLHPNAAGHAMMAKKTIELLQSRYRFS